MAGFRASAPAQNMGYNRVGDWPTNNGSGPMPVNSSGSSALGQWHPTVVWMLGFVVVELVVFHALSRVMNI